MLVAGMVFVRQCDIHGRWNADHQICQLAMDACKCS
jgi:hypothetical protein